MTVSLRALVERRDTVISIWFFQLSNFTGRSLAAEHREMSELAVVLKRFNCAECGHVLVADLEIDIDVIAHMLRISGFRQWQQAEP